MDKIIEIGKIIENRRKFLKLSQEKLASIAGISLRSLKYIEKGTGNPAYSQLRKILDVLGLCIKVQIK